MNFSVKKTGGRMWHEARKQEKKIRGMLVDYRRRAERRRDYYEKIKSDPTQFLQLHGRPCKIYLDPAIAAAGSSPANMMPWQGHEDNLIDRFDVRAHLDWIPEIAESSENETPLTNEERHINYERYRIIVQNEFLGVTEEKFLHQVHLEEQFGSSKLDPLKEKKKSVNNAAIGYNYETEEGITESVKQDESMTQEENKEDDDSDIDLDICVDVSQIDATQAHEMNTVAQKYGLLDTDYFSFLTQDFEEAESLRQARKQEEEKAMYSGRRSRRERRAFREKKMIGRVVSPPSYAARESPEYNPYRRSSSKSRSRSYSPANAGQITYITSFGGEEEIKPAASLEVKTSNCKKINYSSLRRDKSNSPIFSERVPYKREKRSRSKSYSRSSKSYNRKDNRRFHKSSYSRSEKKVHSGSQRYTRSRSRSLSRSHRTYAYTKSRARSRSYSYSRSRSISRSRLGSRGRSKSRSLSRSSSRSCSRNYRSRCRSRNRDRRKRSSYSSSRSKSRSVSRGRDRSKSRSRSKSQSSRISRSRSRSRSKSNSRSSSDSSSKNLEAKPPAVPRYYGRRGKSSSLELSDNEQKSSQNMQLTPRTSLTNLNINKPKAGLSTYSGSGLKNTKITPQERLKKKMQALLNRQYKADKKAEQLRIEKLEQQRQDREDEIREISLKIRKRQRERRHQYEGYSTDSRTSKSRSPSLDRSVKISSRKDRRNRSRDRKMSSRESRDRDRSRHRRRRDSRSREKDNDSKNKHSSHSSPKRCLVDY